MKKKNYAPDHSLDISADCLSLPQSNINSMRAGSAPVFCSLLGPKTYNGV